MSLAQCSYRSQRRPECRGAGRRANPAGACHASPLPQGADAQSPRHTLHEKFCSSWAKGCEVCLFCVLLCLIYFLRSLDANLALLRAAIRVTMATATRAGVRRFCGKLERLV